MKKKILSHLSNRSKMLKIFFAFIKLEVKIIYTFLKGIHLNQRLEREKKFYFDALKAPSVSALMKVTKERQI